MNVKIAGVVLIMIFCIHCQHLQQDSRWTFLGKTQGGSGFYYDPDSISFSADGVIDMWVKVIPSDNESIYSLLTKLVEYGTIALTEEVKRTENIAYSVILYEIDCSQETILPAASRDYDDRGNLLESTTNDKEVLQVIASIDASVQPGTIWEVMLVTACNQWGCGVICKNAEEVKPRALEAVDTPS